VAHLLKPALLLAFLACDWRAVVERLASLGFSAGALIYLGLYGLLAGCLFAAGSVSRAAFRVPLALVLSAAAMFLLAYEWSTGGPLDYNAFETMVSSRDDAGDAWTQHGAVMLRAGAASLLLFVGLVLPVHWRLPRGVAPTAPLMAVAMLAGMIYARGGEGSSALPAAFPPLAHAAIMGGLSFTEAGAERQSVDFAQPSRRPDHDVVLIVDESVAANYLDINHPDGVHSGMAREREGLAVHNFGIAAAISNCSAGSNKSLRYGGTRETYWLAARAWPSIWAYAKKAGMRTVYLDAQRNNGTMQNLATKEERAEIDDFVQLDGVAVVDRDITIAGLVAERLANGVPEFIYVNKVGAHFPVADKFPVETARYFPIPARGGSVEVTDVATLVGKRGTPEEWRLYRNAYRNTLEWNTGTFFDRLLAQVRPGSGVIVYTSDHGQDLHERGNPGQAAHCSSNPLPEEGAVPLVVIDSVRTPRRDWLSAAKTNRDGMSHFRIFPTLLDLMGYDPAALAQRYGPTLLDGQRDSMTFTYTYFASLGRDPAWRTVAPGRLASPPTSDFEASRAAR
jgi:lipid A ethanolaminephosphotransferase